MKSKIVWSLAALNVLLVVALVGRMNRAYAAQAVARPSEYIMVPGEVLGGANSVVYIIDTNSQQLSALALAPAGKGVDTMAPIDLGRVFQPGGVVGNGGAAGGARGKGARNRGRD